MASGTRVCKICGKEYSYCKTANTANVFRWQDVACCPEHGCEYFSAILASRSDSRVVSVENGDIVVAEAKPVATKKSRKKTVVVENATEEASDESVG